MFCEKSKPQPEVKFQIISSLILGKVCMARRHCASGGKKAYQKIATEFEPKYK